MTRELTTSVHAGNDLGRSQHRENAGSCAVQCTCCCAYNCPAPVPSRRLPVPAAPSGSGSRGWAGQ
jgi:hypothetical protein